MTAPVTQDTPPGPQRLGGIRPRTFVLPPDAPRFPGTRRDPQWGLNVFRGQRLPEPLAAFTPAPYSWEALVETELNGLPQNGLTPGRDRRPALRPYQVPRVAEMRAAHTDGAPGYVLTYPTGAGKTPTGITGITDLPGIRNVLVVTKLSVVPPWRGAIDAFAAAGQRWVVIHPELLWRLLEHPSVDLARMRPEAAGELAAAGGRSRVPWDGVIVDESQILADCESVRSRLLRRITHPEQGPRPWTLYLSATGFSSPVETSYLADLIAYAAEVDAPDLTTKNAYKEWLRELGFDLNKDASGRWYHQLNPDDVSMVRTLLYSSGVGAAATPQELGLPGQSRELWPIRLNVEERAEYQRSWEEFRLARGLGTDAEEADRTGAGGDEERAAALRRVQKASILKAPYVAKIVADLVADGHQVAVPAWYLDNVHALATAIARELRARGLSDKVAEITGETPGLREKRRRAFQLGVCKVVVVNAVEGINLHAGERNVDGQGRDATLAPRVCVIADVLTGGKRALQAEGRTQRDGQQSRAIYVFAEGTTEEIWLATTLRAAAGTQALAQAHADAEALTQLAEQLFSAAPDEPVAAGAGI